MTEETALKLNPEPIELSIVMPCLNEAATLETCIRKAQDFLKASGVSGEIIIGDNGSKDGSVEIAQKCGARVAHAGRRGYGVALMAAIDAARGRFVIMGDSDDSYDFSALSPFVESLRQGNDLVMGNRFRGGIKPGAMPPLHRYLGNPILTRLARLFFKAPIGDIYCGLRGFRKETIDKLNLQSPGMEFALEMVVKSTLTGLRIAEVPTTLSPDGRGRAPHLKTWKDGRRSLRFFLSCAPNWLFLYPGALLILFGSVLGGRLTSGPFRFGEFYFDSHVLLYCSAAVFLGFQAIFFAIFAKTLAISVGLLPHDPRWDKVLANARFEYGLLVGGALVALGLYGTYYGFEMLREGYDRTSHPFLVMRKMIPSVFALTLGTETIFSSCYLSLLKAHFRKTWTPFTKNGGGETGVNGGA